jgi:hypothetical protein
LAFWSPKCGVEPFTPKSAEKQSPHLRAAAISQSFALRWGAKETAMKKLFVAALILPAFVSIEARAQERAGSAALGAVSGAIVLGPIGAVAGAFIGYTAGPSIARSWGLQRPASRPRARRAAKSGPAPRQQAVAAASSPAPVRTSPPPAKRAALPPVQGFE